MDNQLTDEQKKSLDDQLKRATAFEEMVHTKGWEYILVNFKILVAGFTTELLTQSDMDAAVFDKKRQQIVGVRNLLAQIDSDLAFLEEFRKKDVKDTGPTTDK